MDVRGIKKTGSIVGWSDFGGWVSMRELACLAERAVKQCEEEEKCIRSLRQRWQELLAMITKGEAEHQPFAFLKKLNELAEKDRVNVEVIGHLREWATSKVDEQRARYTELLRNALAELTVQGRFPEFRINFLIEVKIDEQKFRARMGTRYCSVYAKDISVETIASEVKKQVKRLFNRSFESRAFLKRLFEAYQLVLALEGRKLGEAVRILTVHKFLLWLRQEPRFFQSNSLSNFQAYLPDEFAVDLGRLLQSNKLETETGWRLRLHPIRESREAVFVVNFDSGEGHNFGLISFVPPTS